VKQPRMGDLALAGTKGPMSVPGLQAVLSLW